MTSEEILELRISDDDNETTIREYLHRLLETLWDEKEEFSGKRPFGSSCWEYDFYYPLFKAGLIDGQLNQYGGFMRCDVEAAHKIIRQCIAVMCECEEN